MAGDDKSQQPTSHHRLPTVSAADALQDVSHVDLKPLSLGLERLDALLRDNVSHSEVCNGLTPGQIVEIFGPPGVGKTTLCMQAAAAALQSGSKVLWIDTATPLVGKRLASILARYEDSRSAQADAESPSVSTEEKLSRLSYYFAPTLPHLLALISYPSAQFPLDGTVLVVVDSISANIDNDYPRNLDSRRNSSQSDHARWLQDRRPAAIAELISRLTQLSSRRNVAILLTSTTVTKIRLGNSALLRPAISGQEWEKAINIRLALYRDWVYRDSELRQFDLERSARFVELISRNTVWGSSRAHNVIALRLDERGLHDMVGAHPLSWSPVKSHKRRHEEIADSNARDSSSDYGWDGDDDAEGLVDTIWDQNL